MGSGKKRFHIGEPKDGEEKLSKLFYVFATEGRGTEPVYEFWHAKNQETNIHCGDPWEGEERRDLQFYVYPGDPFDRRVVLTNVKIADIKAESTTKLIGAEAKIDNMSYNDFSAQFDAFDVGSIVQNLISEVFSKVSVGLT